MGEKTVGRKVKPLPGHGPHLVPGLVVLHSESAGYRGPAADNLGEQVAIGVRLELHEVSAGGEGGHGGVRASDYVAVSADGAPSLPATDVGKKNARTNRSSHVCCRELAGIRTQQWQ